MIVGALLLATDLLLTVGVIRRLREHTAELAGLRTPIPDDLSLPAGRHVPAVAGISTDG